jgi:hypothetical protein
LWSCKAPTSCPPPTCFMQCASPKNCEVSTYRDLPPLLVGESAVKSFTAPAFNGAEASRTVDVPVMSQPEQAVGSAEPSEVQHSTITLPVVRQRLKAQGSGAPLA